MSTRQTCVKCGRLRSTKFMQEAVFRNFVGDEGAGIWKCASNESCKQARKQAKKNDYANGHTYDRT